MTAEKLINELLSLGARVEIRECPDSEDYLVEVTAYWPEGGSVSVDGDRGFLTESLEAIITNRRSNP